MAKQDIKVPMLVKIYAGEVLVAEFDSANLFCFVLDAVLKMEQKPTDTSKE